MLEVNLDRRLLLILIGVFAVIGVISKCVVSISLKSLMRAAGNMGKSSHSLMRLVRAKYEHTCMVSDRVQNVEVFVEKYIYEYRILRIRLHSWRRLERAAAWGCLMAGLVGAGIEYAFMGMTDFVLQSAGGGAAIGILLFLMRIAMDEEYCLNVIRTYMVDYLDNFCARKFEKNRELNNPERPRPREEVPAPTNEPEILPPVMPEPYRAPEAGTAPEGLRMAERREYAIDSRGGRAIDNRRDNRTAGQSNEKGDIRLAGNGLEEVLAAESSADARIVRQETDNSADGQAVLQTTENRADEKSMAGDAYEEELRVERVSEKLLENIVESAVADTKWVEATGSGSKKSDAKGKKTARGRKKEQQLAERLAEKAVEKSMEAAAERAAEKLAANAAGKAEEHEEDKPMGALSKEVLIREILEEFLA